ncbi:hypothetical protein [Psychrobacillus psychrodurans]|uniref:hypothetical protein n=1 Tax=Psychrobacillus psychrodurans TaxID=126157 RepID=UPI0008E4275E|nr:hypothetical protein [Psychrobacillus psychrodurans]MCZ8539049.1 hypothetical protein [Psychrobacillus psychrodurans]SFM27542.1 hypothetical protein SAMN05421832_101407 [Psychrobacillus psychrodurans]
MKKKLKVFLIAGLVIVIGIGSYLLYTFKFKEYDTADEHVEEIIEADYKVELPDGNIFVIDDSLEESNGTSIAKETATTNTSSQTPTSEEKSSTVVEAKVNETANTNSSKTKPSSAEVIIEKYEPTLAGLEGQADTKIDALIGRAMGEYQEKKNSGEKVDFGYFYNKYMSAANNLEANTDKVFYSVIRVIEKDLTANEFDKSRVQTLKDEYEAKKKARRDSLISKALENR